MDFQAVVQKLGERSEKGHASQSVLVDKGAHLLACSSGIRPHSCAFWPDELSLQLLALLLPSISDLADQFAKAPAGALPDDLLRALTAGIQQMSQTLYQQILATASAAGAHASLTVLIFMQHRKALLAHLGEGRVYLQRDGQFEPLLRERQGGLGLCRQCSVETLVVDTEPSDVFLWASVELADALVANSALTRRLSETSTLPEAAERAAQGLGHQVIGGGQQFVLARCADAAKSKLYARLASITRQGLSKSPFFAELSFAEMLRISSMGQVVSKQRGDAIVRQGDIEEKFYVILEGWVTVHTASGSQVRRTVGDHIGEMGLVGRAPRSATVVCDSEETRFWCLDAKGLSLLIWQDPVLGNKLYRKFIYSLAEIVRGYNAATPHQ